MDEFQIKAESGKKQARFSYIDDVNNSMLISVQ
jgi:hypothetical protein